MDPLSPLPIIAVLIVLVAVIMLVLMWKRKWKTRVDYRNYFIMGIIWIATGVAMSLLFENPVGYVFLVMGLVYFGIGYKNRGTWGIPQEVDPAEQKRLILGIAVGVILFVLGFMILLFFF
jgi:4-amino-4-deoxy-L-arabinose transferase-like glycosyltransferase